jgi:hypothetical protein
VPTTLILGEVKIGVKALTTGSTIELTPITDYGADKPT